VKERELNSSDYPLHWRQLQQVGLNAYEARSYLVLMGHPRFKALELAARAHVPRQKIYEVLDSLVEKGFAQVVQEKTKLFSAVDPALSIPGFLARRSRMLQNELVEQSRLASGLIEDLKESYKEGQTAKGALDFLSLVSDPTQTGIHYRRLLKAVASTYHEFVQPPFAVNALEEHLLENAAERGVHCRLLVDSALSDGDERAQFAGLNDVGVEVRFFENLPLKLALFDVTAGLIALPDPVQTKPSWTSVVFEHKGFAEAMSGLFENYWCRAIQRIAS
jgi:HTH-type transcriptional regulator, sugar sensing transcriptional regulator